jgi:hypothetical protein
LTGIKAAKLCGELVPASEVEAEWASECAPSRCAAPLPGLTAHDVSEIDQEIREALGEIGN